MHHRVSYGVMVDEEGLSLFRMQEHGVYLQTPEK
jgi:hypothetical protein